MKPWWALVVAALIASSCGGAAKGDLASSNLPRRSVSADVAPASRALDRFGGELYVTVAARANGNVMLSPYSVLYALLMTRAGAVGETRAEIDRALRLTDLDDVDGVFNALDQQVMSRRGERTGNDGKKTTVALQTANAVWLQKSYPIESPFLERLATDYGAAAHLVDYRQNTETARRSINRWVSDRTADKIPELIPEGVLDALTRLVLTNAIYFKAAWAEPFPPERTAPGPFVRLDGSVVDVSFINNTVTSAYTRGPGWQSITVPYVGDELEMAIVVPDSGRFGEIENMMRNGLGQFFAQTTTARIELGLPKFRFRYNAELIDALTQMGIVRLFSDQADLTGITKLEQLFVSDVLHEAYIDVNERGTEAAAATAVVIKATAAPTPPTKLVIDRPFFAAIRDRSTQTTLFLGRITDPIT